MGRTPRRQPDPAGRPPRRPRAAPAPGALVGLAHPLRRARGAASRRLRQRLCAPGGVRHRPLHAARARAQRRRRLGRAPRSRLRRLLRRGRVCLRAAQLGPLRRAPADDRLDPPDRRDRGRLRAARRPAVAPAQWRLPRDRDPLLPRDLPHGDDERRQPVRRQRDGRAQRAPPRRSAQLLRPLAAGEPQRHLQRDLPVRRAGGLRRRLRRAPLRQSLPHGTCVAVAP